MRYIVLKPISPPEGAIIEPAVATADNPTPEPVLVEEGLFSGDTDDERVANIARLIAAGVIAPYEAAPAAPVAPDVANPDPPAVPRRVAQPEPQE
jgi:hypothetical protein